MYLQNFFCMSQTGKDCFLPSLYAEILSGDWHRQDKLMISIWALSKHNPLLKSEDSVCASSPNISLKMSWVKGPFSFPSSVCTGLEYFSNLDTVVGSCSDSTYESSTSEVDRKPMSRRSHWSGCKDIPSSWSWSLKPSRQLSKEIRAGRPPKMAVLSVFVLHAPKVSP